MARLAAFPLALVISLVLLASAVAGVSWVMGHAAHPHVLSGTAIAIAIATSSGIGVWLPIYFGVFAQQKKKDEEPVRLTPLVRRDPATGLREL